VAEVGDVDVHEVVVADELRPPDPVKELAACDHHAGVTSERRMNIEHLQAFISHG